MSEMNRRDTVPRRAVRWCVVAGALATTLAPLPTSAQQTFTACLVPEVGVIYMIGLPGLPIRSALEGVLSLTPIRYRFREGTGHPRERQIGLSAQDVERHFPELVTRDAQGYLSVAYADLSAVLVRAVQEQQEAIDALTTRNEELAARLTALEAGQRR